MASNVNSRKMSATSDSGRTYALHIEDTYAVLDSSGGHDEDLSRRIIKTENGDMLVPDETQPGKGKFRQ